jgi:hypothetical protein
MQFGICTHVYSAAAAWMLPWTEDDHRPVGRPSDVARMIVFDAGLDPAVPATSASQIQTTD